MPNLIRETAPSFAAPVPTGLHAPPSPGTHRALRRLQSAHTLGAKAASQAASQPSLISQQRVQVQLQSQQGQQRALPIQSQHERQQSSQLHSAQQASSDSPGGRNAAGNRTGRRGRSNSDVSMVNPFGSRRSVLNRRSLAADALPLEKLLRDGPPDGDVPGALESTRLKILDQGIKSDSDGMSSLRIYFWLILLNAPILETDAYLALIHRGASPAYAKIRDDTFRTLATDPLFRRRVSEASIIRLLNAVAWKLYDAREERSKGMRSPPPSRPSTGYTSNQGFGTSSPSSKSRSRAGTITTEGSESGHGTASGLYVQGMNVLAAPFLYASRSEAEAFVTFHQLLTQECPGYIRGAMDGVHRGSLLVDKVLAIVDPTLSKYLQSKALSASIYAFSSVLTLCACTPPLPEVLKLWDFLFAYGPHLNILCIVAQLVMIRAQILDSPSPNNILRAFPALQADQIKRTTLAIIRMIPDDMYAEIAAHAQ